MVTEISQTTISDIIYEIIRKLANSLESVNIQVHLFLFIEVIIFIFKNHIR